MIRQCLTLESHGYDVTVIAPRGEKGLKTLPASRGTRLRTYPMIVYGSGLFSYAVEFGWSFLCTAVRLFIEVLRGRAHAVQVCNPPDVYWPLSLILRAVGRPWVFDHHDLCPELYATRSRGRPKRWIFRMLELLEKLTLRTASAVIATNESYRENAVRRGVPPGRITVVRNGPSRQEIGGPTATPGTDALHRIVYVGVMGPQDNVSGAVLAAAELVRLRGRADWRMTIAGDGETMPELAKLIADRGLGDLVEFTGWLNGPQVDELLRRATVAIQPDLPTRMNNLSTMAKTVEYLGRGVPVVAADLLETRRTAGDAASYVPTGDAAELAVAIHELLEDPTRRARMREAGLSRFADLLAWEHQAERYVALWDRLLFPAGRGRASGGTGSGREVVPDSRVAQSPYEDAEATLGRRA